MAKSFWGMCLEEMEEKSENRLLYENPTDLFKKIQEYFQWIEDNPLYEAKLVSHQGISSLEEVPKMRVATVKGLCLFLGMSDSTFRDYANRAG